VQLRYIAVSASDVSSNCLRPCSIIIFEKLIVTQLVKKFPVCYIGRSCCRWIPFWAWITHSDLKKNLFETHFNITIPPAFRSHMLSVPFMFSYPNSAFVSRLSHAWRMPRPLHHPWFDHAKNTGAKLPCENHIIIKLFIFPNTFIILSARLAYCNGFDQRIARQRLRKHGPTRNSRTTGLCKPLLGNSPVNTFQHTRHATMNEPVFYVMTSRINGWSCVFYAVTSPTIGELCFLCVVRAEGL
jgi:hypothetical protein